MPSLTQYQIAEVIPVIAASITGPSLGGTSTPGPDETRVATVALQTCNDYAPSAPATILQEASIRLAGWLLGTPAYATEKKVQAPEGTTLEISYSNAQATANGLRSSGASSLLSKYVVRRAGSIGETTTPKDEDDPDIGTTIMRCGFASTLPYMDNFFRWLGTANSVQIDTSWAQPASFGFWLPNDLMSRVIEVVLLRSIFFNPPQVEVNLAAFGAPVAYQFGDTAGMIRFIPVTFNGNFSQPNDFRAVIGELR